MSFSYDKQASDGFEGLELPDEEDAINEAIDNMPGKLSKWLYKGWLVKLMNQKPR